MPLLLYVIWIILCGRVSVDVLLTGLAVTFAVCLFCSRYLDIDMRFRVRDIKRLPKLIALVFALLGEIMKANMRVVRFIYLPAKSESEIVTFKTDLKSRLSRVALANCITLTPGTITGLLDGDEYTVHCLDSSMAQGLGQGCIYDILKSMEDGNDA